MFVDLGGHTILAPGPGPRRPRAPRRAGPSVANLRPADVALAPRQRVLWIEDEESVIRWGKACLRPEGFEVHGVHNGTDGLHEATASDWALIILDLRLPGMPGPEVLRRARAGGDPTPVIILTGRSTEDAKAACIREGIADYLYKPVTCEVLLHAVRRAILRRFIRIDRTTNQPTNQPLRTEPPLVVSLLEALSERTDGYAFFDRDREHVRQCLLRLCVERGVTIPVFLSAAYGYRDLRVASLAEIRDVASAVARRITLAWGTPVSGHKTTREFVEIWETAGPGCAAWKEHTVAAQLGIRAERLSREVHADTDFQAHEWRLGGLLRMAVRLLAKGDMQIKGIAGELGYGRIETFTRNSKGTFGIPPLSLARELSGLL